MEENESVDNYKMLAALVCDKDELHALCKGDPLLEKFEREVIRLNKDPQIRAQALAENIETAKNMLNKNIDIDTIAEVTGLPKEEIEKLKKDYLNISNRPFFVCCVSSLCFIKPSLTKNESRELLLFS